MPLDPLGDQKVVHPVVRAGNTAAAVREEAFFNLLKSPSAKGPTDLGRGVIITTHRMPHYALPRPQSFSLLAGHICQEVEVIMGDDQYRRPPSSYALIFKC
jgi:hypothetical protein